MIEAMMAVYRATRVYVNEEVMDGLRERVMQVDFSWERSAKDYEEMYDLLT